MADEREHRERQEAEHQDAVGQQWRQEQPDDAGDEREDGELDRVVQPVERQESRRSAQRGDERLGRLGLDLLVAELVQPAFARATCTMSLSALLSTITRASANPAVVQPKSAGNSSGQPAARMPSTIGISASVV